MTDKPKDSQASAKPLPIAGITGGILVKTGGNKITINIGNPANMRRAKKQ